MRSMGIRKDFQPWFSMLNVKSIKMVWLRIIYGMRRIQSAVQLLFDIQMPRW